MILMKHLVLLITLFALLLSACDVQSEISKKSVEKYTATPSPAKSVEAEAPIDPADVINVDISQEGPKILVNTLFKKTILDCNKYNRVSVNGDAWEVTIKGACSQLVVNGDRNKVSTNAITEIMFNGAGNSVQYAKYINGKRPFIADNGPDNTVEKIEAAAPGKK